MAKIKSKLYTVGSNKNIAQVSKKSKSIRSRITASYLWIYFSIFLCLILVLFMSILFITYYLTDAIAYEFLDYIVSDFNNFENIESQLKLVDYDKEYLIVDAETGETINQWNSYATIDEISTIKECWILDAESDEILYKESDFVNLDKQKFTQKHEKSFILSIKDGELIHYFYANRTLDGKKCEIYLAVDGIPALGVANIYFITLFIIIIIFLFVGLLIMSIFGTFNTQRYLSPLKDISNLTKQINSDNLNMRLDVASARCELKELVMTINNMLDRVHIGYLKQKQFVSDVSHELRTPISIIDGYANMLMRWAKDDEKVFDESLNAIIEETSSMKTVVENLLLLARYDNNTLVLDKSTYSISDQMDDMYKELMLLNNNKHVLKNNIEPNVFINGDKIKIRQAIREFCKNAVKYTPVQGVITVSLSKVKNNVIITVKDTGIGITRKDIGRIFERFYRADRARTRTEEGYGLGLSISRAIIVAHKGFISLKSKDGVGTEIKITIPVGNKT